MRVLIIDDDPRFRMPLRATLALQGFDVVTVASAESAEAVLAHEVFDAVLSDIGLPGIDGVTLAARHPDVPFVLMTGSPPPDERVFALPSPERIRLMKPFDTADVVTALRAVVEQHQAAHQR